MRIFINASNLIVGGGLTIGLQLIQAIQKSNSDHFFEIVVPCSPYYTPKDNQHFRLHQLPEKYSSLPIKIFANSYLSKLSTELKVDRIFSLTNYGLKSDVPQLLMLHWPYAAYPESEVWSTMDIKNKLKRKARLWLLKKNLKHTSALTVQTEVMQQRIEKHLNYLKPIHVVPSYTGFSDSTDKANPYYQHKNPNFKSLLFLSEFYEHKNLQVLIPLAERFKNEGDQIRILTTLNEQKNETIREFFQEVKRKKLDKHIVNLQPIERANLKYVFEIADGLFHPSSLETFGLVYLEAMQMQKPIFTSDMDFSHAVCKDTAFYFDPHNLNYIHKCITTALSDTKNLDSKLKQQKNLFQTYPDWNEILQKYIQILSFD